MSRRPPSGAAAPLPPLWMARAHPFNGGHGPSGPPARCLHCQFGTRMAPCAASCAGVHPWHARRPCAQRTWPPCVADPIAPVCRSTVVVFFRCPPRGAPCAGPGGEAPRPPGALRRTAGPRWVTRDAQHRGDAGETRLGFHINLKKNSCSRSPRLQVLAVRFSCDELINSLGWSGLHPTLPSPGPPRAGRLIASAHRRSFNSESGRPSFSKPGRLEKKGAN